MVPVPIAASHPPHATTSPPLTASAKAWGGGMAGMGNASYGFGIR